MKTKLLFSLLFSLNFYLLSSQIPQGFNYQAIARDGTGNPIPNATIMIKLSILSDTTGFFVSGGGTYIWEEEQTNVKTNAFGLITVIFGNPLATKKQGSAASFSAIDWAKSPLYIGTKIANPTIYKNMGTAKLMSVPYSMVADSTKALLKGSKLSVVSSNDLATDALFEVKRKDGQTVFAVYPDAVNIYVPRTAKGTKGGFAIGGFDQVKTGSQDYFRVTPDSVRVYIDKTPSLKGATKGGFAIGGFDQVKNTTLQDLFTVSNDSIRIYLDANPAPGKGATKGGFAIGGFDQVKGAPPVNYLNVATDVSGLVNPSQNRILWYPIKNAFLTGKVLIEKPDSVGVNSFASGYETKAKGQYSQALGYRAIARGDFSTSIGKNAVAQKINSFAFGEGATASNSESYAIGRGAFASGYRSFALGSAGVDNSGHATAPTRASGDYSFAIGQGSLSLGYGSVAIGLADTAGADYSLALGYKTSAKGSYSVSMGVGSIASGNVSVAMGNYAMATTYSSISIGDGTRATGNFSTAFGYATTASAGLSTAMGAFTIANGYISTALGNTTTAKPYASLAIGQFNDTTCSTAGSGGNNTWVSTDPVFIIGNGTYTNARSNAFTVLKNGKTAIGHAAPTQMLDVNGNARFRGVSSGTFGNNLNIMADGTLTTATSDISMKENIYQIANALDLIIKLRGVSFNWKGDLTKAKQIGMIAQEVEPIIPEIVFTNTVDGLKGINYSQASALFVEAIKEQQRQIEFYKSEIRTLKEKVGQIESQQKEIVELKTLVNTLVANQAGQGNK